jgi:hypothetical protein
MKESAEMVQEIDQRIATDNTTTLDVAQDVVLRANFGRVTHGNLRRFLRL